MTTEQAEQHMPGPSCSGRIPLVGGASNILFWTPVANAITTPGAPLIVGQFSCLTSDSFDCGVNRVAPAGRRFRLQGSGSPLLSGKKDRRDQRQTRISRDRPVGSTARGGANARCCCQAGRGRLLLTAGCSTMEFCRDGTDWPIKSRLAESGTGSGSQRLRLVLGSEVSWRVRSTRLGWRDRDVVELRIPQGLAATVSQQMP